MLPVHAPSARDLMRMAIIVLKLGSSYLPIHVSLFLAVALVLSYALSTRRARVPKGLREPPTPPGARLLTGHSHIWSGSATSNPSEGQLVKWAQEHGEIYQIWQGTERWVVLSSPEAIKVCPLFRLENLPNTDRQKEVFDRNGTVTGSKAASRVTMGVLSGGYRMLFMVRSINLPPLVSSPAYQSEHVAVRQALARCSKHCTSSPDGEECRQDEKPAGP